MRLHTFTFVALLAAPALAKPIAHIPLFQHHRPTNTNDPSLTCIATPTPTSGATCNDVASQHNIQLYAYEASISADSDTCRDLLAGYGICIVPSAPSSIEVQPVSSTYNSTFETITAAPNSSYAAQPLTTLSTITTTRTTTLTYTIGTGTSQAVRTIVVTHTTTDMVTVTTTVELSSLPSAYSSPSLTSEYITTSSSSASSSTRSASSTTASISSYSSSTSAVSTSTSISTSISSSGSSSACSATAPPPAATQGGIVAGCTEWYVAVSGDYCSSVADRFGISVDTFMAWNPAVEIPTCPHMQAGDAYCVATCDYSSASLPVSTATTSPVSSTATYASATATATGVDVYRQYNGDGSLADGWPAQSSWVTFDYMFEANTANMKASCAQWGVPDDSDAEVASMKTAIQTVASSTGVDARLILATIMQESTGCVRVITSEYSVFNPGLMQSHNGTGTCNTNNAALGLPGVSDDGTVQTPCPYSEIRQQIQDGAGGTSSGDGLEQCLEKQGHTDVSRFYRAARMYNGGSIDPSGDLGKGCCTLCYASDIANRLTGWVDAPHACTL